MANLFFPNRTPDSGELFETLLTCRNVTVERIVSSAEPEEVEYVQEQDEWVVILEGSAELEVAGAVRKLARGESLFLPAKTPHRVLQTAAGTIWLAVHIY